MRIQFDLLDPKEKCDVLRIWKSKWKEIDSVKEKEIGQKCKETIDKWRHECETSMIGLACTRFKSATVAELEEWQWILLAAYLEVNIVVITEKSEKSYPWLTNFKSKVRIQQIKKKTQHNGLR